jgi:hypothetical protein
MDILLLHVPVCIRHGLDSTPPHFDYAGQHWEAFSPQCNIGALIRCQGRGFLIYMPLNWLVVVLSGLYIVLDSTRVERTRWDLGDCVRM